MPKVMNADFQEKEVWSDHTVEGSGSDTTDAISIEGCDSKIIYVKSNKNCTVTVQ